MDKFALLVKAIKEVKEKEWFDTSMDTLYALELVAERIRIGEITLVEHTEVQKAHCVCCGEFEQKWYWSNGKGGVGCTAVCAVA